MKEVKCQWCGSKGVKNSMSCEAKPTGKLNKNGSEKYIRKYFHDDCFEAYKQDKKFKENEATEFDELYNYLLNLHRLERLDSRMIERIQDIRNGTVKYQNRKIKRYKEGVPFAKILEAYKFSEQQLHNVRNYKTLETSWQEFTYFLSIVINNLNEMKETDRRSKQQDDIRTNIINKQIQVQSEIDIKIKPKIIKKDELDISSFL